MKTPIIKYSDKFLSSISWFMSIGGITLYPFIVLRERYRDNSYYVPKGKITTNHESVHIKQQEEVILTALILLIILNLIFPFISWWLVPLFAYLSFYILYVFEWFIKIFRYKGFNSAYRKISFEQEAYGNEKDMEYLKNRTRFNWIRYIFK